MSEQLTPRQRLYLEIQQVVAGHQAGDVMEALLDATAAVIGLMVRDEDHADALCAVLGTDVRKAVALNWDDLRKLRSRSYGPDPRSAGRLQ